MSITPENLKKLRLHRMRTPVSRDSVPQIEHIRAAGASLVMSGVLVPGEVIAEDASAAGLLVGVGSILKIHVSAPTYVAFGDGDIAAVDASTSPGLLLEEGVHLVVATDDFVRASAAFDRLEVIKV